MGYKLQEARMHVANVHDRAWRVWIVTARSRGWLRGGFTWRTKTGAVNAARKAGYVITDMLIDD